MGSEMVLRGRKTLSFKTVAIRLALRGRCKQRAGQMHQERFRYAALTRTRI